MDKPEDKDGEKKCQLLLDLPNIAPGWGCCKCRVYNGIMRDKCKMCKHEPCHGVEIEIIVPDTNPDNLN